MKQPKKRKSTTNICAQIKQTQSVEELSDFVYDASLKIVGFDIDPELWDDIRAEDLVVLETLVVRLRELVEAGKLSPESWDGNSEEDPPYDP